MFFSFVKEVVFVDCQAREKVGKELLIILTGRENYTTAVVEQTRFTFNSIQFKIEYCRNGRGVTFMSTVFPVFHTVVTVSWSQG